MILTSEYLERVHSEWLDLNTVGLDNCQAVPIDGERKSITGPTSVVNFQNKICEDRRGEAAGADDAVAMTIHKIFDQLISTMVRHFQGLPARFLLRRFVESTVLTLADWYDNPSPELYAQIHVTP